MAKKIKVSRKKMKRPDEFITFTDQVVDWFNHNRNLAYGIIGGVILALALFNVITYSLKTRQAKADRLLLEAFSILNAPLANELTQASVLQGAKNYSTPQERADEGIKKLSEVIQKFGSGQAGLEARFHLGEVYLSKGDYGKALESYQDFLKYIPAGKADAPAGVWGFLKFGGRAPAEIGILQTPTYLGMATAYYSADDYPNAQTYYRKVLDSKQDAYLAEANLGLARTLIRVGQNDEAKKNLEVIIKSYPGSIYDQLAKIELSKLSGEKAPK